MKFIKNILSKTLSNFGFFKAYQRWIPVEESTPENYQRVIIKRKKIISVGDYHGGSYWWDRGYDQKCESPNEITHWMPLPPKD